MKDKNPNPPRKTPSRPDPVTPPQPGGPHSGTTQEISRAEILAYLEKMREDGGREVADSTDDETAYLLGSPANRERLLRAIDNVAKGRDLAVVDLDEIP